MPEKTLDIPIDGADRLRKRDDGEEVVKKRLPKAAQAAGLVVGEEALAAAARKVLTEGGMSATVKLTGTEEAEK